MKTFLPARFIVLILLALAFAQPAPQAWAGALDVQLFGVIKQLSYVQDSDKVVRLDEDADEGTISFDLFLDLADGGSITSATVGTPGSTNIVLLNEESEEYQFSYEADHLLDLNQQHPNGTYTFSIVTVNNGTITAPLSLTGGTFPSVPRVSNFTAAQSINASANFTLTWDAFTGGTASDFIEVYIEEEGGNFNEVFHSGPPGAGGLNGTSTSVLIPAGTLTAGKRYHAQIMFAKVVHNQNYSGSTGIAAYTKRTSLYMATTGTVTDTQAPILYASRPFNFEQFVPVKSVIRFDFNEPMQQVVSINWTGTGLTPANFTYTWSHDDRSLFAVYTGSLPASTQIGWTLNPIGGGSTMRDKANNTLSLRTGSFTTSGDPATSDPDVDEIFLLKVQSFVQTSGGVTAQDDYEFEIFGDLNIMNGVLNGTVTIPTPSLDIVRPENDFYGATFDYDAEHASKTDLDRFFPNGTYTISLNTAHNGTKNISLNFPADNYPNDPTLQNFGTLAAVNHAQPLTLNWGAFSGADNSESYFIEVIITNGSDEDVYSSSDGPGALTGTSTQLVIPANTLSPGRKYECELVFARIVASDATTYTGAKFAAAFAKVTKFEIQTTGTPIRPTLSLFPGTSPAQVDVTGDKYVRYVLEATQDFQSWFPVQYPQNTFQNTSITLFDDDSSYFSRRFYRVKEVTDDNFQLPISLQGYVRNSSNSNPIAGATVSTTLSGATAVTDSNGMFFLQTDVTSSSFNMNYGITVNKTGFNTHSQNSNWGDRPRNLNIFLNPQ
ncbi:MAG: CarboxypepD reg-like domain [Verrucomicrobia bacterium]|nr:CarboxypepD reg-like domain [Verrucomicrobiota bacterium]